MSDDFDIVIAGGGVVGNTLACALGGSGLSVAVIEPGAGPGDAVHDPGLRVSAITPASKTVFENLGAWSSMSAGGVAPVETMRVWEQSAVLEYDSADIGEACLAWIVENRVIVDALAARLSGFANIVRIDGARVERLDFGDDQIAVFDRSGRRWRTRLVVGADGAGSRVRSAAGIEWVQHDLGQTSMVCVVQTSRSHGHCAFQRFHASGPLALLPLADPRRVSIVWSLDNDRARQLMAANDAEFQGELQAAFGDQLGTLELEGRRASFPLALGFARQYTDHRIALVGDAAHTVHPLAGQGVNLGILDAATLAEVIVDCARRGSDPGLHPRLRRYERRRKGSDLVMQVITGGFRYLFGSPLAPARVARQAGLQMTDRLAPLRNFFMREAAGIQGELPRLAQRFPPTN